MSTERQYLDDEQARHLYHNDQTFRQLVDCMVVLIRQLRLTPGEVRSAATFAAIQHEMRYPKTVYLSRDPGCTGWDTRPKPGQEGPRKFTPPIGGVSSGSEAVPPSVPRQGVQAHQPDPHNCSAVLPCGNPECQHHFCPSGKRANRTGKGEGL